MSTPRFARSRLLVPCLLVLACGKGEERSRSAAIHLVDLYDAKEIAGTVGSNVTATPPTVWRFDGPAPDPAPEKAVATRGWVAGPGIEKLSIRDGRLTGTATKEVSVLHFERTPDAADRDTLYSIEVKARVSAGRNLQIDFSSGEKADLGKAAGYFKDFAAVVTSTPILPGTELRTYTLKNVFTVSSADIRHIFLRPTDAIGGTFEIESIRLVFRREYLERIASGPGWQGLSEIYHETIVTRSPEVLRVPVKLPARPWLDLAVGTVEEEPVTFRVTIAPEAGKETVLLRKTLTRAHRWERVPLDLGAFSGKSVAVSLAIEAAKDGAIGFWGSPVIRSHEESARAATAGRDRPRNVVLIWADTLRRDHLSAYGYERKTSPEIERMAKEGVLFRHSVSQATWTKVATPTLLTSLYPATHGVADFMDRIPVAATTLAEVFRQEGYATLSLSSILFTGKFTNLHQGFDEVHESGSLSDRDSSKTARDYVDRVLPWIDAHEDAPFFVFLHVSDPHDPYQPYAPYDAMWADRSLAKGHEKQAEGVRKFISDPLLRTFGMPTREELAKAGYDPDAYVGFDRDWYDGSIRGMDAEIGRLLERIRSSDLADRTVVVFTGDHGEEFLEHGRTFHGQSVYGELTNVPLVLWSPGFLPQGKDVTDTVETVDVMPTLLDLCGLPVPKEAQGRSLRPLLVGEAGGRAGEAKASDEAWTERPAFTQKVATSSGGGAPPPYDTESFAITSAGWKLVHHAKRAAGAPEYELFDAEKDPLNLKDEAAAHADVVEKLRPLLDTWRKDTTAARLKSDEESTKDLSPEDLERLRSLGYVQ